MDKKTVRRKIDIYRDINDGSYLMCKQSSTKYVRLKSFESSHWLCFEKFSVCSLEKQYFPSGSAQYICNASGILGVLAVPNKLVAPSSSISNYGAVCGQFYLVCVTQNVLIGTLRRNIMVHRITDVSFIPLSNIQSNDRQEDESITEIKRNRGWILPFVRAGIDQLQWLAPVICGGVFYQPVNISHNCTLSLWLISRMSCKNVGTRFITRGTNDFGYAANFVETEQILIKEVDNYGKGKTFDECSFVVLRGSVPLHWTQSPLQVGSHRISITRSLHLSYPSFVLHFKLLAEHYDDIMVLSLSSTKQDEGLLTRSYFESFENLCTHYPRGFNSRGRTIDSPPFQFTHFDYHEHMKNVKNISIQQFVVNYLLQHRDGQAIWPFILSHGYWHFRTVTDSIGQLVSMECHRKQTGVIRFNCLDCLDRTNVVQSAISNSVLFAIQTIALGMDGLNSIIQDNLRCGQINAWNANGDAISRIYTGTGALTGKSRAHDVTRSFARALQNNLYDESKTAVMKLLVQSYNRPNSFDQLLYTHLSPQLLFGEENVLKYLINNIGRNVQTKDSPWTYRKLRVGIYSWNINGDKDKATETNKDDKTGKTATLSSWLLDGPEQLLRQRTVQNPAFPLCVTGFLSERYSSTEPDIYAIGFQEICDINASSIVKASEENMQRWYCMISSMLNMDSYDRYVCVCQDQLVGVCLILFAKESLAPHIRFIKTAKIKTGFMNSAGNKGCVAVRFSVFNTTLCFICAHFEAGQNQVAERNDDYNSIISKLSARFRYHDVMSHDYLFFFGDFNYRINLTRPQVLDYINRNRYNELLSADQLIEERLAERVFKGFEEGPIMFAPTYKYDYHCQEYDTSEKARIPSWTDRIMWRRGQPLRSFTTKTERNDNRTNGVDLLYYARTELMTSDHRPVSALLNIDVVAVDKIAIESLYRHLRSHSFQSCLVKSKSAKSLLECSDLLKRARDEYGNQLKDSFCVSDGDHSRLYLFFKEPEKANMVTQMTEGLELVTPGEKCLRDEFALMFGLNKEDLIQAQRLGCIEHSRQYDAEKNMIDHVQGPRPENEDLIKLDHVSFVQNDPRGTSPRSEKGTLL
ncbi:hypothetical protein ACOME3_009735 [Neoechinorhynchus agilis]